MSDFWVMFFVIAATLFALYGALMFGIGFGRALERYNNQWNPEIDRNARAYGWEIGKGRAPFSYVIEYSEDNPFISKDWRRQQGLEEDFR